MREADGVERDRWNQDWCDLEKMALKLTQRRASHAVESSTDWPTEPLLCLMMIAHHAMRKFRMTHPNANPDEWSTLKISDAIWEVLAGAQRLVYPGSLADDASDISRRREVARGMPPSAIIPEPQSEYRQEEGGPEAA